MSNLLKIALILIVIVSILLVDKFIDSTFFKDEKQIINKENLPSPWDSQKSSGGRFPIIASNIIKVDEVFDLKIRKYPSEDTIRYFLQKIRESNFTNLVVNLTPAEKKLQVDEYYKNFFSALEKVNSQKNEILLRALIYDKRLSELETEELFPLLKSIYPHPDILGFYIDEPSPQEFNRLAKISNKFNNPENNYFYQKLFYVNLFGVSSVKDYEVYLNNWLAIGKPRLISFDNYAVWDDDLAKKSGSQIGFDWGNDYFLNLEIFRVYSNTYKIPFWNWITIHKHNSEYSKRYYRRATPSEISFQIFSALIYGAKGILYYNFWNPDKRLNQNGWNEEEAILNPDGTETELFEEVERINSKVQKIGSVLMSMENVGVYHSSNKNFSRDESGNIVSKTQEDLFELHTEDLKKKYGIKLIDWNRNDKLSKEELEDKIITSMDNPFAAVGIFKKDKNYYLLIVNKNRKGEEEIKVKFDSSKFKVEEGFVVSIETNRIFHISKGGNGELSFTTQIAAGDASLFRVINR